MNYRLSPSDLTYLFEGCKFCFNVKIKHRISQSSIPLPGIFSAIAGVQKNFYAGRRTEEFCKDLPPGIVRFGEKWIQSVPIRFKNSSNTCYIAGRFDLVIEFDHGGFGVIDCKTASPSEVKTRMYGRQLQCYAYALENPAPTKLALSPINKLGLLYFQPFGFEQITEGQQAFQGDSVWREVRMDKQSFLDFMSSVIEVLDSENIYPQTCNHCNYCKEGNGCLVGKPEALEKGCTCCLWCTYRARMREIDEDDLVPLVSSKVVDLPLCSICGAPMRKKVGKYGEFWSCERFPDCKGTRDA